MSGRLVLVGEGQGEVQAVGNLVVRVLLSRGHHPTPFVSIPPPLRLTITSEASAVHAVKVASKLNPSAVLLTADLDDDCPAEVAPRLAVAIRNESPGFPTAVVLFHREYETLAISVATMLDGRVLRSAKSGQEILTLHLTSNPPTDPEEPRDAKGWISRALMGGVSYKPTVHQAPLTKAMAIDELAAGGLSSYRRLESGLDFLASEVIAGSQGVYPHA